jgi:HlyD family secretion protein
MSQRRRFALLAIVASVLAFFAVAASRLRPAPPSVSCEGNLWTETVKRGPMLWDVRGAGTLVPARNPGKLIARVTVPDVMAGELRLNQNVDVDTRKVLVKGHVTYISPSPSNGMRNADIALRSPLPEGVGENLQVNATIHLGSINNILYVGRPVHAHQNSSVPIFKIVDGGKRAVRVVVRFGHASIDTIEVLDGLHEGDKIIPSDMSAWDNFDQIRLW